MHRVLRGACGADAGLECKHRAHRRRGSPFEIHAPQRRGQVLCGHAHSEALCAAAGLAQHRDLPPPLRTAGWQFAVQRPRHTSSEQPGRAGERRLHATSRGVAPEGYLWTYHMTADALTLELTNRGPHGLDRACRTRPFLVACADSCTTCPSPGHAESYPSFQSPKTGVLLLMIWILHECIYQHPVGITVV